MKKLSLTTFLLFASLAFSYSQTKTINISQTTIGRMITYYQKSIDLDHGDTSFYVRFMYRNNTDLGKITHTEIISFDEQKALSVLIKDLESAITEFGSKTNLSWVREDYAINLYENIGLLYLFEKPTEGKGYVAFNKKNVIKLKSWLETINLGKG